MRRLINWIYARVLGLQVKTHEQHLADLRRLLADRYLLAQEVDADIEILTHDILKAKERRDEAAWKAAKISADRRKSSIDERFPDPIPRSY